jgi:hypothetical protein
MQLTLEQRIFIVDSFGKQKSEVITLRAFQQKFGIRISRPTVKRIYNKWKENGTIHNLNKENSGRQRTGRSEDNIDAVRLNVMADPNISVRKLSAATQLSKATCHRICRKDLQMKPYKLQCHQEISGIDKDRRLLFCNKINDMVTSNELNLMNIIFSDECHIYLKGTPNRQNFRYWSSTNPVAFTEKPLHSPKVTVWCGLSGNRLYGPYFFEDPNTLETQSINRVTYLDMLKEIIHDDTHPDQWFQQDGATAHTAGEVMAWLNEKFPGRLISHRSVFQWPPRSPDLSPLDFYLWGFVKERVFHSRPANIRELKCVVTDVIRSIDVNTLRRVVANFQQRIDKCIVANGGHFEG